MATSADGYPANNSSPAPAPKTVVKKVTEQGDQRTYPKDGQMISIHYIGYIAKTGEKFDSSLERGKPLTFQLGARSVIVGFEEGVKGMSLGERAFICIPAAMGYGEKGSGSTIPPDTDLVFDLKLMSMSNPPTEKESQKFQNSKKGGSLELLKYFCKVLRGDCDLELPVFEQLLPEADVCATVSSNKMDGASLLHILSQLSEDHPMELIQSVLKQLVDAGADLAAADRGETPLTVVLCMLEEEEREEDENDTGPPDDKLLETLILYLDLDQQQLSNGDATRLLHQVGRISDHSSDLWVLAEKITRLLEKRFSKGQLEGLRQGDKLIDYLCTFFDTLTGHDPKTVQGFLDDNADPAAVQTHSGSNAFHFVALNAYGEYNDVLQIFEMLLERNAKAAEAVDKTGFTVFSLASDYKDTSRQFDCKPNPSPMLALAKLLPQYDVDAGLVCLKVDEKTRSTLLPRGQNNTRFREGDRVKCWVQAPGGSAWEEGVVISLGYREESWPEDALAPYEVKLDIGGLVFVLADTDKLIRAEHEKTKAAASTKAEHQKTKAATSTKRFIKQPTENGWELLDTKTGKTRASSPPDSDSD